MYRMMSEGESPNDISTHMMSSVCQRLIKDLKSGLPIFQQSLANVLGLVDYNKCQKSLSSSLGYLLDQTRASVSSVVNPLCFVDPAENSPELSSRCAGTATGPFLEYCTLSHTILQIVSPFLWMHF
jgi:hypothetical protein